MYKNYVFDLYGTLVDIRTNENKAYLWDKMTEIMGFYGAVYERQELKQKYQLYSKELEEKMKETEPYPEIDLAKVFRRLFEEKQVKIEEEKVEFIMNSPFYFI